MNWKSDSTELKPNENRMKMMSKMAIQQLNLFIQVGTLPYLSKKLGADPTIFGQLQTVFAVTQLLGGPIFGRIGDTLGERFALIMAFSGATLSYFLMGIADNLPM